MPTDETAKPTDDNVTVPARRGPGRPSKKELAAKKPGGRGKVGRPPGDAAIINDYKARMLASPKSPKVLEKILDVALTDEHPHQAACMKMVVERLLPRSYFDKDTKTKGTGGINITISGLQATTTEEIDDAEYEEV